ncbi:MAG: M20/M25/M40 family metallo-hydrolase [Acidobacteria bacterium]|nr:M20/M25/M40 family metallo-hydrolase [Acidobacteriota bacterium]
MFKLVPAALLTLAASAAPAGAPERINHEINARIRQEARENSRIMRTLHFLTDLHGPRLTGSPNHKAAAEWTIKQLSEWGLENAHLEPWDFGHDGWLNERFSGFIVSPVKDSLVGEVLAWTPSTSLKGRIVLVGKHAAVPVTIVKTPLRRDYEDVRRAYDPVAPTPQGPPPNVVTEARPENDGRLSTTAVGTRVDEMLVSGGAALRVNDAGRDHGQIRAFGNRTFDLAKTVPTVVLRNEDYGRVSRILADGMPVTLEFTIVNRSYPEGRTSYNAIAEIPGTDKKDEVVMLGGHLDSWHAATGATDNAIGCAVMMEAARILKAIGVTPRRTIRVVLWGGEEQGLLGSKAYVQQHFGTFENQKPAYGSFAGYFNVDSGTGRIRGASVFGPPAAATVLREAFAPFEDLGVMGATATKSRRSGGTDSTSFNAAGLPGIGLGQDPIEYGTYTWHTNLDTYERIIEEDVKKSATAIAAALYHLAMRDEMLPRFSKEDMPAPAPPPVRTQ